MESTFKATLTVTVDVGAEVRAACGEQSISALSTNGTVVLELPSEGKWRVTAARGMTQYSTAIVDVTSSYQAALTAEIYVEYYGAAPVLSAARSNLAAPPVSGWTSEHRLTVFAGGNTAPRRLRFSRDKNIRVGSGRRVLTAHANRWAGNAGRGVCPVCEPAFRDGL